MVLSTAGCVKETYDMKKLSKVAQLSPTLAISAIKGDIALSDMVKSSDTVVFDQNKFVKIVFRKDSVFNLKLADVYSLNNMVSVSKSYSFGEMNIGAFSRTMSFTLNDIIAYFSPTLRGKFQALDNTTNIFLPFPSTNLGENVFPSIPNLESAVFASGTIDISVKNNLPAPLSGMTLQLYNSVDHTPIGSVTAISTPILPGATEVATIDLANKTVKSLIVAAITITGSPGSSTPVPISLNGSGIDVEITGSNLKVKSGRIILPANAIGSAEAVSFDPGSGVELDKFKIVTGNLSYHIQKPTTFVASLSISIPTANRNGTPVSQSINLGSGSLLDGNISFNNTIVYLGTDTAHPFNSMPYSISVSSSEIVDFNSTDEMKLDLKFQNPVFDYIKGYFGQKTQTIAPDSTNFEIEDILKNLTGDFLVSSPSIKINYSNSFAIPIQMTLNATGQRKTKIVNLGLAPFTLASPVAPVNRDISASVAVDKSNSSLPELISLPPEKIRFSGSARLNPGVNNGLRDNYVFGDSRFLGSLEVEVPLDFRINNLQFTDTVDNFLKDTGSNNDNPLKPENFELLRVDITAKNGFPLGVSLKMSLYDSNTHVVKSTVDATGIIAPAPIDSNGKSTGVTETSTTVEFTKIFFSSVTKADKIIFQFTLNTTGNGTKDIKIYSDYRIDFNAALVVKPGIKLN